MVGMGTIRTIRSLYDYCTTTYVNFLEVHLSVGANWHNIAWCRGTWDTYAYCTIDSLLQIPFI